MNREAIIALLNAEASELCRKYGVQSLSLFGSPARGDDREARDVDILVTFKGSVTFRCFMGLKLDLEDLFGRRVDLLTPKRLSPVMRDEIDKESVVVVVDISRNSIMYFSEIYYSSEFQSSDFFRFFLTGFGAGRRRVFSGKEFRRFSI